MRGARRDSLSRLSSSVGLLREGCLSTFTAAMCGNVCGGTRRRVDGLPPVQLLRRRRARVSQDSSVALAAFEFEKQPSHMVLRDVRTICLLSSWRIRDCP